MDYSIVRAIIISEMREHLNDKIILVNFSYGDNEGEIDMLKAREYVQLLLNENICRKCDIALKVDNKEYMFIEFCIQR